MSETTRDFGQRAEDAATAYLEAQGFQIVARNYYAKKLGEIDIIALKEGVIHFIEVKSSKGNFDPIYNLTPTKLRRLINSAHYYLKHNRLDMPFCIDALLLRQGAVELIENLTL